MMADIAGDLCVGVQAGSCIELYFALLYLVMLMLMPALLPTVFAAHSVVGQFQTVLVQ